MPQTLCAGSEDPPPAPRSTTGCSPTPLMTVEGKESACGKDEKLRQPHVNKLFEMLTNDVADHRDRFLLFFSIPVGWLCLGLDHCQNVLRSAISVTIF